MVLDNTDNKSRKMVNIFKTAIKCGEHEGCGGEVVMQLDNPFGTFICKRCKKKVDVMNLNKLKIKKIGG